MITYTKRNLFFLVLSLTILIFIISNLVIFPFITSIFNNFLSKVEPKKVYSRIIPLSQAINENSVNLEKKDEMFLIQTRIKEKENYQKVQINNSEIKAKTLDEKTSTQRQVVKDNKSNKWRIQIPKLNLDVHIMEGTSSNILLQAVGHFDQTSKWQGNIGLAAHNRGYECNFFQKIKNLKLGDEIIYTVSNGKKVYKVQTNKVILETDWSYLNKTKDNRITLITCEENRPGYRRCVQAIEVANYKI